MNVGINIHQLLLLIITYCLNFYITWNHIWYVNSLQRNYSKNKPFMSYAWKRPCHLRKISQLENPKKCWFNLYIFVTLWVAVVKGIMFLCPWFASFPVQTNCHTFVNDLPLCFSTQCVMLYYIDPNQTFCTCSNLTYDFQL